MFAMISKAITQINNSKHNIKQQHPQAPSQTFEIVLSNPRRVCVIMGRCGTTEPHAATLEPGPVS